MSEHKAVAAATFKRQNCSSSHSFMRLRNKSVSFLHDTLLEERGKDKVDKPCSSPQRES